MPRTWQLARNRLDRFEVEHDNFRLALDYLIKTGDADWSLRLGAALFRFWETREHLTEGRDAIARILAVEGAGTRPKLRARLLFAAAVLAGEQGDYGSAQQMFEDSLESCLELEDNRGVAVARNALVIARDPTNLPVHPYSLSGASQDGRNLGDPADIARALSNLASVLKLQGEYARASSLYDECLAMFRQAGDGGWCRLEHRTTRATSPGKKRDCIAARSFSGEQSLAEFRRLRDSWGIVIPGFDLASLSCDQGRMPRPSPVR